MGDRPHVVIVGGGFGGLTAAQSLRHAPVQVTVVDRANHHVFQPLLYQVAMAGLSPAEIASPIRSILARQRNARVLLGEATGVDFGRKTLLLADGEVGFDVLVLATGARTSWFGHDEWSRHALSLKSLEDAIAIRERVLLAFERAERATEPAERARLLTFVSIGGGPTGVELAGSIAELARFVLARDFRTVDPKEARVVLLEAGPRIFPTFTPDLSQKAVAQLQSLGVETRTGARVTCIDERGAALGEERIDAATVVWAAGVRAAPLAERLGLPCDRSGRVLVEPDLSLPGQRDCFAIGDMAALLDARGQQLPGISAVAMQQARAVAASIACDLRHAPRAPFVFRDPGSMATIGRSRAICELGRLHLSGFAAWLFWLLVHLWFLIGFRNRFVVMFSWTWSYFTYRRGARLITHVQPADTPRVDAPLGRDPG